MVCEMSNAVNEAIEHDRVEGCLQELSSGNFDNVLHALSSCELHRLSRAISCRQVMHRMLGQLARCSCRTGGNLLLTRKLD